LDYLTARGLAVRGIPGISPKTGLRAIDLASDTIDWPSVLTGVDTIIHCAGVNSLPSNAGRAATDYLYKVNRDATGKLARACLEHGVRRLMFTSTAKVYGDYSPAGSPFFEDAPLRPADRYGDSKRQAEACLLEYQAKGLQVCILRLPMVYGPELSPNLKLIQKLMATGLPLPLASVRNRRSVLGVNNLAVIVDKLLALKEWPCPVLNLADPKPVSTPELIRIVAAAWSMRGRLVAFPPGFLKPLAKFAGRESTFHSLASNLELHCADLYRLLPDLVLEPTDKSLGRLQGRLSTPNG